MGKGGSKRLAGKPPCSIVPFRTDWARSKPTYPADTPRFLLSPGPGWQQCTLLLPRAAFQFYHAEESKPPTPVEEDTQIQALGTERSVCGYRLPLTRQHCYRHLFLLHHSRSANNQPGCCTSLLSLSFSKIICLIFICRSCSCFASSSFSRSCSKAACDSWTLSNWAYGETADAEELKGACQQQGKK